MLTDAELNLFQEQGYLLIKNFFDPEPYKAEAAELLRNFDLNTHPKVKFTTGDTSHIGNEYFLNSGDKIHYFLEEQADLTSPTIDKTTIVNKIGHGLHELNPVFSMLSKNPKVVEIAQDLKFKDPRILQSMLIFKQAKIGGEVPSHVDSTFLYTDPPSCCGLWFAMDNCTIENGCMYFAPGSHKKYKLYKRFVRDGQSKTKMTVLQESDPSIKKEPNDTEYVPVPVSAGDLVLIHGMVYHKSHANRSPKSRWIYTFHMIEGSFPYASDNWLLPTEKMPFTKLF